MNARTLLPAIKDGRVKESTIDDKVLRLLRTVLPLRLRGPSAVGPGRRYLFGESRQVALEGARESITLLKNENHALPLDAAKLKTIAVIGPNAWPAVVSGGGSALPTPISSVSTVEGVATSPGRT